MATEAADPTVWEGDETPPRPEPDPTEAPSGGRHRPAGARRRLHVPSALRPGSTGRRLESVDVARGLAVVAAVVALTAPTGGLHDLAAHLAAPLFALLVGVSTGLALDQPHVDRRRVLVDHALRGVVLVGLGVVLQAVSDRVDVPLPAFGLLVLVLAPLALLVRPAPVFALGLVVAGAVLGPLAVERARDHLSAPSSSGGLADVLLGWVAGDPTTRLVSLLPVGLAGVLLVLLLRRLTSPLLATGVAAVLLAAAAVVHGVGRTTADGAAPSSGTTAQVVAGLLLASGVVALAVAAVLLRDDAPSFRRPLGAVLGPLAAAGRLPLTAAALVVLVLAVLPAGADGAPEASWWALVATAVVVLAACWALDRFLGGGPLEVLVRAARLPERGRHGGAVSGRRTPPAPAAPHRSTRPEG